MLSNRRAGSTTFISQVSTAPSSIDEVHVAVALDTRDMVNVDRTSSSCVYSSLAVGKGWGHVWLNI